MESAKEDHKFASPLMSANGNDANSNGVYPKLEDQVSNIHDIDASEAGAGAGADAEAPLLGDK